MFFNIRNINSANILIKSAGKRIEEVEDIINSCTIPEGFGRAPLLNNVKFRISELKVNTKQIANSISNTVSRVEMADETNKNFLDDEISDIAFLSTNIERRMDAFFNQNDNLAAERMKRKKAILDQLIPAKSFSGVPDILKKVCPEEGRIISVEEKGIQVYLPYGYSEDKEYDVLVLLHGDGGTQEDWLSRTQRQTGINGKTLIDNMIYYGACDPMIVVTVKYQSGEHTDMDKLRKDVEEETLPYIVTNFSTYASCNEEDSLEVKQQAIASEREHFAIAGLSRGGMAVEEIIGSDTNQYFAWYGCFSGFETRININNDQEINAIYFSSGDYGDTEVAAREAMQSAYNSVKDNPQVKDTSLEKLSGDHGWDVWQTSLYNMMLTCFKES